VQQAIESGEQVVVGVNRFRDDEVSTPALQRIDPDGERRQGGAGPAGPRGAAAEGWAAAMDHLEGVARSDAT